jgi:hypothetical protein
MIKTVVDTSNTFLPKPAKTFASSRFPNFFPNWKNNILIDASTNANIAEKPQIVKSGFVQAIAKSPKLFYLRR